MIASQLKMLAAELSETTEIGHLSCVQSAERVTTVPSPVVERDPGQSIAQRADIDTVPAADSSDIADLLNGPKLLPAGQEAGTYVSFGSFVSTAKGLHYQPMVAEDGGEAEPPIYVCDPIRVVAQSRDEARNNWGIVVAWTDDDGFEHVIDIPLDILISTGEQVRQILQSGGLRVDPAKTSRTHLVRYLSTVRSERKLTLVTRTGWHGARYVAPGAVYSSGEHDLLFRSKSEASAPLSIKGSLDAWKAEVGRYAVGNGLLMLGLGAAFAAPLLTPLGLPGGGLHFRGPSSVGKSVLMKVAASVWSDSTAFTKSWRATSNGLEGIASAHNDGLLLLDELGESDPKSALATVYMVANGVGKVRATRSGEARNPARWKLLFLSTGEVSLADLAASDRFSRTDDTMAGQEVRFLDVQADTGQHGIYSELHDMPSGRALSEHLERATARHHGTAMAAYLQALVRFDSQRFEGLFDRIEYRRLQLIGDTTDGQVGRAARRFAIASIGAELASELGVGPWTTSEAFAGIKNSFDVWLRERGGHGAVEEMQAVRRIRDYITVNASRFQSSALEDPIDNRAGFAIALHGKPTIYAFTPKAFRDALAGLNPNIAAKALHKRGFLPGPDGNGKHAHSKFLGGQQHRVYLVNESILNSD